MANTHSYMPAYDDLQTKSPEPPDECELFVLEVRLIENIHINYQIIYLDKNINRSSDIPA